MRAHEYELHFWWDFSICLVVGSTEERCKHTLGLTAATPAQETTAVAYIVADKFMCHMGDSSGMQLNSDVVIRTGEITSQWVKLSCWIRARIAEILSV